MIILDPPSMPDNLSRAYSEDRFEPSFPSLAYNGRNVLPTALGYMSFFGEATKLNIGRLPAGTLVQQEFTYQTVAMFNMQVALCEDGLWIANATEGATAYNWTRIVDRSASAVAGVRRLWTMCVISNRVYLYQQGNNVFYGLVNLADYAETSVPSTISATITQVWSDSVAQVGLLAYTPSFINMAGQIGLFKASNRLGFWDSDGAVAWSSATQVYDFKPSVTTFAGITTFTDVVGQITLIKQHGNGFLIYATRSITLASFNTNSPEKWSGRAIFSDVGVLFDNQVAVAQPDLIHYAITSGGLCRITEGVPEFIEPEVMDYIRRTNEAYAISFIDSRYLFIHATTKLQAVLPVITAERLDAEGNKFVFPEPQPIEDDTFVDYLAQALNSFNPSYQEEFTEVQEPVDNFVPPVSGESLLPCWSGGEFGSSWTSIELVNQDIQFYINSKILNTVSYPVKVRRVLINNLFPYFDDPDFSNRFIDKAGEEFTALIQESLDEIQEVLDNYTSFFGTFNSGMRTHPVVFDTNGATAYNRIYGIGAGTLVMGIPISSTSSISVNWGTLEESDNLLDSIIVEKVIDGTEIELMMNDCGITCTALNFRNFLFKYKFKGVERFLGNLRVYGGIRDYDCGGSSHSTGGWLFTNRDVNSPSHPLHSDYLSWAANQSNPKPENYIADRRPQWIYGIGTMSDSDARGLVAELRSRKRLIAGSSTWVPAPVDFSAVIHDSAIYGYIYIWKNRGSFGVEETTYTPGFSDDRTMDAKVLAVIDSMDSPFWILDVYAAPYGVKVGHYNLAPNFPSINWSVGVSTALENSEPAFIDKTRTWTTRFRQVAPATATGSYYYDAVHETLRGIQFSGRDVYITNKPNAPTSSYTVEVTVEELPMEATTAELIKAEVSGYGYYPNGEFSFRKTHSRSLFKPCNFAGSGPVWNYADQEEDLGNISQIPIHKNPTNTQPPPSTWPYPDPIELPPNYALFQKGTLSPYYQTYEEAVLFDTQLNKWGRYNTPHKLVYSLFPVNRTDNTIVPSLEPMRAGALSDNLWSSLFTKYNPDASITYGKIGAYRLGVTKATKFVVNYAWPATGGLISEVSLNGRAIQEALSQGIQLNNSMRAELPFTATGKWFNIRLEGSFDVVSISLEGEARGRR